MVLVKPLSYPAQTWVMTSWPALPKTLRLL